MSEWLRSYYGDVDSMNLEGMLSWHTDDVVVKFGSNPPAQGKEEVGRNIGHFWSLIRGLRHEFVNTWDVGGDTTVLEALIDYTRADGTHVSVPATSILHRTGELIDSLRIYIDVAPVFAPEAT